MLQIWGCIVGEHDLRLVALAILLCAFSCWTTVVIMRWALRAEGISQRRWILAAAVVFGSGVWATHFVGMLAYTSSLFAGFDAPLTLASFASAVILSGASFALIASPRLRLLGAALLGAAVGVMHYIGMAALQGPFTITWQAEYVFVSLALGVAGTFAAGWAAFRFRSYRGLALATAALTFAVSSVHFTGMTAATLIATGAPVQDGLIAPGLLAIAVAAAALLIVTIGFFGAMTSGYLHSRAAKETARLRAYVMALEAAQTELQETSQMLRLALAEAAAASATKSQFLSTMSHELRTPLNAVIGFSEMLQTEVYGPLGDPRYGEYAGHVHESGKHLLLLINDILDLTRLDAAQMTLVEEDMSLGDIVAEAMGMVAHQADAAKIVLCAATGPYPSLRGDPRRVRQILLNLLSNALKFTPDGGRVSVDVADGDDGIAITVRDTGIGMAADDIPKALERFGQIDSRLSRKYEGAGLGLAISKHMAELHGGTLTLTSEVDVGTAVTVIFPATRVVAVRRAA